VKEELRIHTLDAIVAEHENMRVVRELLKDAEALYQKADRYTRAKPARGAKQDMRREAKDLKAESRQLERQAINHVLDIAEVVCATTAIDDAVLGDRKFDWVVLDEACQTTEPASWIPLMRGERILLAGDGLREFEASHEGRKIEISRFKGLGEMDWQELGVTTMDPATRSLLRVSVEDAAIADDVFSRLMGDDVESRKKFIQTNAKDVRFVDV
jgi:DNA gyrase/topoisomerase IV subunit B